MAAKKTTKTTLGLSKEVAGALTYVLGFITGIIFLLIEKDKYVRFHAMQSVVVFGSLFALQWILGMTLIFLIFVPLITILTFVLWLLLIYKAWTGSEWEVPVLGKWSRSLLKKF